MTYQEALTKRKIAELNLHRLVREFNALSASGALSTPEGRWIADRLGEQIAEEQRVRATFAEAVRELRPATSNYVFPFRASW
jgi:hypothetical protein